MKNNVLFAITVADIQEVAINKIGREFTEEELYISKKCLENALLFDIDTIYNTIFTEVIIK